ncbi:MAG TPA: serine/threonine-protein kinase [Planctomycetota bacterium]|nr:serine/threonine-protein kinase [Planctomycetota bacterium]
MAIPERPPAPSLGQIVLEKGWATIEQINEARRLQARKKASGEKITIAEAMVSLGILTEVQVRRALGGRLAPPPPSTAPHPLAEAIKGYLIEKRLGAGGMGDVYRAQQISLNRPVALKILPSYLAEDEEFVERFVIEARAAGKLSHQNIVAAVDIGESNGRYFFVMELVQGPTLQQVIQREGAIAEPRALDIARQIARGLRHASLQGLIHRDIKPSNIMFTPENVAKICDFGLARDLHADASEAEPGIVQSSPAYASPEQSRGSQTLDHRTDMYSLGVTLFEMLTGKRPFAADSPAALLHKHVTEAAPEPRSLNPEITPAANQLVLRLLKKKPEQRFESYDQLLEAMDAAGKSGAEDGPPPRK